MTFEEKQKLDSRARWALGREYMKDIALALAATGALPPLLLADAKYAWPNYVCLLACLLFFFASLYLAPLGEDPS